MADLTSNKRGQRASLPLMIEEYEKLPLYQKKFLEALLKKSKSEFKGSAVFLNDECIWIIPVNEEKPIKIVAEEIRGYKSTLPAFYDEFQPVDKEIIDKVIKPFNIERQELNKNGN